MIERLREKLIEKKGKSKDSRDKRKERRKNTHADREMLMNRLIGL